MFDPENIIAARGILTLSRDAAQKALRSGNPDAPKLLLWLALHPQENDPGQAAQALSLTDERLQAALKALGLSEREKPADKTGRTADRPAVQQLPDYTGEELKNALEDERFAFLCAEAERCFRRPLRRHECSTLLALYEDVGVPAEVLALVLTYCAQRAAQTAPDGAQARVSFAQVRAEAMRWHESGVDTAEKAEDHIRMLGEKQTLTARVLRILGVTDRRPSPTELRYIESFLTLDPSLSLIAKAYDITVVNKGALIWPYMRSILLRWHEKGYKTPEDVESGESGRQSASRSAAPGPTGTQYEDEVLEFLKNNEKV